MAERKARIFAEPYLGNIEKDVRTYAKYIQNPRIPLLKPIPRAEDLPRRTLALPHVPPPLRPLGEERTYELFAPLRDQHRLDEDEPVKDRRGGVCEREEERYGTHGVADAEEAMEGEVVCGQPGTAASE